MDELTIDSVVTYKDEHGEDHQALVTCVHGPDCINVVYVSSDPSKTDSYGRQIERATSVQRQAEWTAHGRYFTT